MKHFIIILLTTLIIPNVTNNGATVTIPSGVNVDITGDLILNSGNIDLSGNLNVSGDLVENGGTISGDGNYNGSALPVSGCTDELACNYNSDANYDDGSCDYSCQDNGNFALNFDGDNDYVKVLPSEILSVSNEVTYAAWFKHTFDENHGIGNVFRHGWFDGNWFRIEYDDNKLYFNLYGSPSQVVSNTSLEYDKWYLVVGTYDGENIDLYIDGTLDATRSSSGTIQSTSDKNLVIGGALDDNNNPNELWDGSIGSFAIWDRALSENEIQSLSINQGSININNDDDLLANWIFNEGQGDIIVDYSGNQNHGTIYGAEWVENIEGCMDELACNYDLNANQDDGSCQYNSGTWYVSVDGDNGNCGSESAPLNSIQSAINASSDGDTILVSAGTYEEIQFNGKGIAIISTDGPENTIIDAGGIEHAVTIQGTPHTEASLIGFTLTNGWSNNSGGGLYVYRQSAILSDLIITNNSTNGNGGGIYASESDVIISNSTIKNNQATSLGGGIEAISSMIEINHSNISHNIASIGGGIHGDYNNITVNYTLISNNIANSGTGGGAAAFWEGNQTFNNCTIVSNKTPNGEKCAFKSERDVITIYNSIIDDHDCQDHIVFGGGNFNPDGSESTIEFNVLYSNIQGGIESLTYDNGTLNWLDGNINTSSNFTNIDTEDYTLQPNSPCIDSGDPNSELDPDGTRADMGAFYYDQIENPILNVEVISPNGGEVWQMGETYEITWDANLSNTGIFLHKNEEMVLVINGDVYTDTNFLWTIPTDLEPGNDYKIRIKNAAGLEFDFSDNNFSIIPPNILGCTDELACNYNSDANTDDNSCDYTCHDNGDYSLYFDGNWDNPNYVNIGRPINLFNGDDATIFIRFNSSEEGGYLINNDTQASNPQFKFMVRNDGNLWVSGASEIFNIEGPYNDSQWYDLFVIIENGCVKVLIDNLEFESCGHGDMDTGDDFYIGAERASYDDQAGPFFKGFIDEVKMWNYALENFNNLEQSNSAFYKFNSGSENILYDHSGNGKHGTIYGAEWVENIEGCTDELACNYSSDANIDDGSCIYNDLCGECGGNNSSCTIITDIDGNQYGTVVIGEQIWMASNLKVEHFSNGESIPFINASQWGNNTLPAYTYYDEDVSNIDTFGLLYSGHTISNENQVCPEGTKIPSTDDIETLLAFLGDNSGGKLKDTSLESWNSPNSGATNETFFSGKGGGSINTGTGAFLYKKEKGWYWVEHDSNLNYQPTLELAYDSSVADLFYGHLINEGISVRCLMIQGCTDELACNYDENATQDDGSCSYIEEGACDCDGNILDACGICGGAGTDLDEDGICDDVDDCVGEYDDCGVCNGANIDKDDCGICYGDGVDADEDGICDDVDDCVGEYDDCGICNGANANLDDCGVCFGDNIDKDCNGNCFGTALYDDCGVCSDGDTGLIPNADKDCNGDCFGQAYLDDCDVCSSGNSGHEANSNQDCNGDCFGMAVVDDCGICTEGNTGYQFNSDLDDCGVCFGENQDKDCTGECFGTAVIDECGICEGPGYDFDGNLNGDCLLNIQDVVVLINAIINYQDIENGDLTGDSQINILDIVYLVNLIFNDVARLADATNATLLVSDYSLALSSNGYIGGIQMTLSHGEGFAVELTENSLISDYSTKDNITTLVVVEPLDNIIFTTSSSYEIVDMMIVNSQKEVEVNLSSEFSLGHAYPNPFNPSTTISLTVPMTTNVSVKVYNLMGQVVDVLSSGVLEPNVYSFTWDASDMSSGVYIIKAESLQGFDVQKVLLVK